MATKLTSATIVDHLWSAANVLRASGAPNDTILTALLALLLLKRESDVGRGATDSVLTRLWSTTEASVARDADVLLVHALVAMSHKHELLASVPQHLGWTSQIAALRSARELTTVVARLRELDLRDSNLDSPLACGDAAGLLIEKFEIGSKHGEHSTPDDVVDLVTTLLAPARGMRITDPFCGHGRFLAACARRLGPDNAVLFGQDINRQVSATAAMYMALYDCWTARIETGDSLRDPRFIERGMLAQADIVMSTPPFGGPWRADEAPHDRFNRFRRGIPPRNRSDFAIILHMLAMLSEQGRMAVLVLGGALFRAGAEGEIRDSLIRDDLVEAVIGLPPSTLYNTPLPPFILILNRAKAAQRRNQILFIQAERAEGRKERRLPEALTKQIAEAYARWHAVPGFAQVVRNHEIVEANLSPGRYVQPLQPEARQDLEELASKARHLEAERDEATAEMDRLLQALTAPTQSRGARSGQ